MNAETNLPRAAPASTSDGKWLLPSTLPQATPVARTTFPIWTGILTASGKGMDSRFRFDRVEAEKAPEEWLEGKLSRSDPSGRVRRTVRLSEVVAPSVIPRAAASTAIPFNFE